MRFLFVVCSNQALSDDIKRLRQIVWALIKEFVEHDSLFTGLIWANELWRVFWMTTRKQEIGGCLHEDNKL